MYYPLLLCILSIVSRIVPSIDHYHATLWTQYLQGHHNHEQAKKCYNIIFKNNPSVHIYPIFIEHLFDTNKFQGIIELTPCIEQQVSFNIKQKLIIAESFLQSGNIKEAISRCEEIASKSYNNMEIIVKIVHLYTGLKNYTQALVHLDTFLARSSSKSNHYIIYFTKAHIYLKLYNYSLAKENALKSLELNPHLEQAWLILAFIYNKENNTAQARYCYEKYNNLIASC